MPSSFRLLAASAFLSLVGSGSTALAQQADGGPTVQQQMEQMQREMQRIQQENSAMRGEIDQMRAEADDQWLTEKRAGEIKALVADVLADADTRAALLDTGVTAGWNDHFFLASGDGRFLLQIEGMEQIRFIMNHHEGVSSDRWRYGFENARTQLAFSGHVFDENIEYMVRSEFARSGGANGLLDAWVRYRFTDKWGLRFGQFKLPYNREFLVGDGQGLAVERSLVSELFSVRRGQGIEFEYVDIHNRFSAAFSDGGSSSIAGSQAVNTVWSAQDTEWTGTGRYERLFAGTWDQFGDFTSPAGEDFGMLFGIGVHGQQGESTGLPTTGRDEVRFFSVTGDLSVEWGGANVFVSAYWAYLDSARIAFSQPGDNFHLFGFMAQAGVYVAPKWEIFARFEGIAFSAKTVPTLTDFMVISAGVNYYIDGHDLKWTTDLSFGLSEVSFAPDITGFRTDAEGDDPQIVLRTQFQILF
jgi:hypothetical protein